MYVYAYVVCLRVRVRVCACACVYLCMPGASTYEEERRRGGRVTGGAGRASPPAASGARGGRGVSRSEEGVLSLGAKRKAEHGHVAPADKDDAVCEYAW